MTISVAKLCDFTIEALLYFLLIFIPLAFGGVQILPLTILESISFLILAIWLIKRLFIPDSTVIKAYFWLPVILFILLVIFQLFPLPKEILGFLSPKHLYIFTTFVPAEVLSKVQYCLTIYKEPTLSKLFELLSYVSVFFVLLNTLETKKQFKRLILVIISMGFLVSIIGMAKGFTYPFINRNHFAGYMELVFFITAGYSLTEMTKYKRVLFSFIAMIMLVAIFLSLSRAGSLSFLGALIFMFTLLKLRKSMRKKSTFILTIVIIGVIFLGVLGGGPVLKRFSSLFDKGIISSETRWAIDRDVLNIIVDFPAFGTGLGTFRNIYPMYNTLQLQDKVNYAHNDFLQLISEVGFLGLGLALWFLYLFFRNIFIAWLSQHHPFAKGIVLGGACAIFSLLLHSFFDFNLQIPANAFLFTVAMAIIYKCSVIARSENTVIASPANGGAKPALPVGRQSQNS